VSDRGIGMTAETVKNYFLKAGASLRRNELWRRAFEDEQGKSKVLRSGRFGIGALAAFLLGDEIYLSTRYVKSESNEGVEFVSQLEAESIELRRTERPVGTTIKICISNETKNALVTIRKKQDQKSGEEYDAKNWDWYCLSDPKVTRLINGKVLNQGSILPSISSVLSPGWHRIFHSDYIDIHWTYNELSKRYTYGDQLFCNGIRIENVEDRLRFLSKRRAAVNIRTISLSAPHISVFDPDAKLPLNLQRTELTVDTYPFHEQLQEDVIRDFLAYLLVNIPNNPLKALFDQNWTKGLDYPGYQRPHDFGYGSNTELTLSPLFITKRGVGLRGVKTNINKLNTKASVLILDYNAQHFNPGNLYQNNVKRINSYFLEAKSSIVFYKGFIERNINQLMNNSPMSLTEDDMYAVFRYIFDLSSELNGPFQISQETKNSERKLSPLRILISQQVQELSQQTMDQNYFGRKAVKEWSDNNWVVWKIGKCPDSPFDLIEFANKNPALDITVWPCILVEFYSHISPNIEPSLLETRWNEILDDAPVIPYNLKERRKRFGHAYKELHDYIRMHELLLEERQAKQSNKLIELQRRKRSKK
jgi:hypothetical protein